MTLLLDTCAFIWLASAPEYLGEGAVKSLDDQAKERALSLVSVWEITLKHHIEKLLLPSPPEIWIEEQIRLQDISVLPLHREVLYLSGNLPKLHKDSFDRLIVVLHGI